MSSARLLAICTPAAFAALALVLCGVGAISAIECFQYAAAIVIAFVPAGLVAPSGWRRRAAETSVLPVALVLALVGDVVQRSIVGAALVLLASLAAAVAAASRASARERLFLAAALGVAARAISSTGPLGTEPVQALLAAAIAAVLPAATARLLGFDAGLLVATLAGTAPVETLHPALQAAAIAAALAALRLPTAAPRQGGLASWFPAFLPLAILLAMLSPWGAGGSAHLELPAWPVLLAALALLPLTLRLPPAAAGAAWFVVSLLIPSGSLVGFPAAVTLDSGRPQVTLPPGTGAQYAVHVALANASNVSQGTPVAELGVASSTYVIRAGVETAEWAHERADVRAVVTHALPKHRVWRPLGLGPRADWAVAGRTVIDVPKGVAPVVTLSPLLDDTRRVVVTGGPADSPPAGRAAGPAMWLTPTACVVAVIQIAGGAGRSTGAWLPWMVLVAGSLSVRTSIEPVASWSQQAAPEIALAALVAAWLPSARRWLARRRFFLAAAALLVPLAAAAPYLSPPLGDDAYHLLLMESLTRDGDLDIANNFDLDRFPNQAVYRPFGGVFLHSPVLAVLLTPGYVVAGRSGASVLLSFAGAALLALVARRALQIGVPPSKVALASLLLLFSYPLATFSTQLWTEVPGALLAFACAVPWGAPTIRRHAAAVFTVLATLLKTRLLLVALPPTVVAWAAEGKERRLLRAVSVAAVITAIGWMLVAAILDSPLDPLGRRHFSDLVPRSLSHSVLVIAGLTFDAAGGMAFSAPLLVVAALGLRRLWRRGGEGDRALVVGGAATLIALLHVIEWRGGDSPPARYLVPLWGTLALAMTLLVASGRPWRSLLRILVPPTVLVWWVGVTRPSWLVNVGDGGFWLGDIAAARFGVDALDIFPSFLRPSPSRWLVPACCVLGAAAAAFTARRRPTAVRLWGRAAVALWLALGAATLLFLTIKPDRVVEIEDPQVRCVGGSLEPPPGAFSRFLLPNGVRLKNGGSVTVPVRIPPRARVVLEGWLEGDARRGATLLVAWSGGDPRPLRVAGEGRGDVPLPGLERGGRQWLQIRLQAPPEGSAVLDRLVIGGP